MTSLKFHRKKPNVKFWNYFENKKRIERFAFEIMRVEKSVEDNFERVMLILKSIEEGLNYTV